MTQFEMYRARCDAFMNAKTHVELTRAREMLLALGEEGAAFVRLAEAQGIAPKLAPANENAPATFNRQEFSIFRGISYQ